MPEMDYKGYRKIPTNGYGTARARISASEDRAGHVSFRLLLALLHDARYEHLESQWSSDALLGYSHRTLYERR